MYFEDIINKDYIERGWLVKFGIKIVKEKTKYSQKYRLRLEFKIKFDTYRIPRYVTVFCNHIC